MTWLRLEDNMLDHPKWRRALRCGGDECLATWVRLVSWCSRNLTDGLVPADMVQSVASVRSVERSRAIRALSDAGLISVRPSGDIELTDYLERNPSRQQVLEERERRASAQRNRRVAISVTGHAATSYPARNEVPARPGPARPNPIPAPIELSPPEPTKPKPPTRKTAMPEGFAPGALHRTTAHNEGLDLEREFSKFVAHHEARGSRFINWGQALHGWLLKANSMSPRASNGHSRGHRQQTSDYIQQRIAEEEAKERGGS